MPNDFLTKKGLSYHGPEFKQIANDLQGNILKSHGRNHTSHIFFKFRPGKEKAARAFIKTFEKLVTSAAKQKADTKDFQNNGTQHIFTAFYLSGAGYDYLKIPIDRTPGDLQFKEGMQTSAGNLSDVPAEWDAGYRQDALKKGVHGMIMLGFSGKTRAQLLERETNAIFKQLTVSELADVFIERGDGIKNDNGDDIEHFGYVDGISQPRFFIEELDNPDLTTAWNPLSAWDLVLVDDPGGKPGKSFGSYLVFRKLEQHVRDFKKTEQVLATALLFGDGIPDAEEREAAREVAGALIVGRFENGMPVTLSKTDDSIHGIPVSGSVVGKLNNFNYDADDKGARCPFHAHVRKSNPRGESQRLGAPLDIEQGHTMARRGIIYGKRDVHPNKQTDLDKLPNGEVGLLFMSFQQNLDNQFEFIQKSWVNEPRFIQGFVVDDLPTGRDPIIGQGEFTPLQHRYARTYDDATTVAVLTNDLSTDPDNSIVDFGKFVTTRGGDYFFAPSKTFLRTL